MPSSQQSAARQPADAIPPTAAIAPHDAAAAPGGLIAANGLHVRPVAGMVYMLLMVSLLSVNDAAAKWLTAAYPVVMIMFARSAFGVLPALWLARRDGGLATLRTDRPFAHLLRSALMLAAWACFILAIARLSLTQAFTIGYAAPLIMTALSGPMLGEKVGAWRWGAVIVGFLGVVVAVQPGRDGINDGALYGIAAAFLYALAMNLSRRMSATERSSTIFFYYTLTGLVVTAAILPFVWVPLDAADLWLFGVVAVFGSAAHYFMAQAFRFGEVSLLAPLEYTGLVWAALLGWIVWRDVPDTATLAGAAIIIASGLVIVRREARLRRRAAPS
ncbi:MAG: DMT family transporter [Alphaproteobacteria bacterium]